MTVFFLITSVIVDSYISIYRIFTNFAIGFAPEFLLVLLFVIAGKFLKLRDILITALISPLFSFALLQFVIYVLFHDLPTFQMILLVTAQGSVLFGLSDLLIGIVVGSISHMVLNNDLSNKG
ncbi:MAG: hypothetical protein KBH80_02250 [Fervidobacterium sp.]|nr:hypothetical protein [Fervidobacterium sp.]